MGLQNVPACVRRTVGVPTTAQVPDMEPALKAVQNILPKLEARIIEFLSEWPVTFLMPAGSSQRETLVSQVLSDYPRNAGFANGLFVMTTATDHKNLNSSTLKKNYRGGPHMRSLISIDFPAPEMEPESAHVASAVSVP